MTPASETSLSFDSSDRQTLDTLRASVGNLLPGKEGVAEVLLCALLTSGHVLFEDVPGVGKTTLIKAMARLLGLDMTRIQCTSDLLPSDIVGVEIFHSGQNEFVFHPGPIFTNVLFVDELNRASPRTQSALLEAMAEGAVTLARVSRPLPQPFLVFAAQNPSDAIGTYPLPESQMDRFAARVRLGYPNEERERAIFARAASDPLDGIPERVVAPESFVRLRSLAERGHLSDRLVAAAKRIVDASRRHESLRLGISTRGGVLWLRMARARALLWGRDFVTPDDLLALADPCLSHRVLPRGGGDAAPVIEALVKSVDVT